MSGCSCFPFLRLIVELYWLCISQRLLDFSGVAEFCDSLWGLFEAGPAISTSALEALRRVNQAIQRRVPYSADDLDRMAVTPRGGSLVTFLNRPVVSFIM